MRLLCAAANQQRPPADRPARACSPACNPAPQRRGFHVYVVPLARRDWFNVGRALFTRAFWSSSCTTHPGYSWCAQPVAQAAEQLRTSQARPLASPSTPQPRLLPPCPLPPCRYLERVQAQVEQARLETGADQVGAWRPCVPACASAACAGCSLAAERSCMAWGHRDMGADMRMHALPGLACRWICWAIRRAAGWAAPSWASSSTRAPPAAATCCLQTPWAAPT